MYYDIEPVVLSSLSPRASLFLVRNVQVCFTPALLADLPAENVDEKYGISFLHRLDVVLKQCRRLVDLSASVEECSEIVANTANL